MTQINLRVLVPKKTPRIRLGLGAQGSPGVDAARYVHLSNVGSAATVWIINHNLGYKPIVQLFTPGGVKMSGQIVHITDNQSEARFNVAELGYACCI